MTWIDIENAIINRLKDAIPEARFVETYGGQLEESMRPMSVPGIYVLMTGAEYTGESEESFRNDVTFQVIAITGNLRLRGNALQDDDGGYEFVASIIRALTNRNFGLDMARLQPGAMELIFINQTNAAYGISFHTEYVESYAQA